MRILLDVDGVVANFMSRVCSAIFASEGTFYTPSDFRKWDLSATLSSEEQASVKLATWEKHWCYLIRPYEGAREFADQLRTLGDVRAVTAAMSRSPYWHRERRTWLADRVSIPEEHVVFCPGEEKTYHDGDVLIEDRLETCIAWKAYRGDRVYNNIPTCKAILIDRPWNQGDTPFGVYRVHSYAEAIELIKGMT